MQLTSSCWWTLQVSSSFRCQKGGLNVIALVTEVCIIYVIYGPYMYVLFRNHIYIYIYLNIYIYLGK